MKRRLQSVRRVLDVQREMHRLAEQRLRDLRRHEAELEAAQETLIQTLGRDLSDPGRFTEVMASQVGRLARRASGVAASRAQQTEVLLQHTGRLRHVENVERDLATEDGRRQERKQQNELGDLIAVRRDARLR